jgi:hypothetical protein
LLQNEILTKFHDILQKIQIFGLIFEKFACYKMNFKNFLLNLLNNFATILSRTRRQAAVATDTRTAGCTWRASTTLTSRPTHIPPENAESVSAALEKSAKKN